jgi:hypothetical protein
MVTKGYRKGVYDWITKGTRGMELLIVDCQLLMETRTEGLSISNR